MRRLLVVALLLLCLPMVGEGQSIRYYPAAGGGETNIVEAFPNAPTTGTSEELLYTVTVPANTWNAIGKSVFMDLIFTTAANGNTKIFRVRETNCAGTIVGAISATSNNLNWYATFDMVSANTTNRLHMRSTITSTSTTSPSAVNTTTCTFSGTCSYAVCGTTATAAADITLVYVRAYTKG